jgi:ABC-type transport system substrate-binding protein
MRLRSSQFRAAISAALTVAVFAVLAPVARVAPAHHPQYGGTLRVEIGVTVGSLDPAASAATADEAAAKREIESLLYEKRSADGSLAGVAGSGPFRISEWQPGKHLALAANEDFSGGRPFVDAVEIEMGRNAHDRLTDIELGRADFVEIPAEDARQAAGRGVRISSSQPDQLIALVFQAGHAAFDDARVREAIAGSIDRAAIVDFILQKEGVPAGALLPEWSSGTSFLFPTVRDSVHAKEPRSQIGTSPEIRLGYDSGNTLEESIAERIAVDTRESGIIVVANGLANGAAARVEARLVALPMASARPAAALAGFLATLGPMAGINANAVPDAASAEQVYASERAAMDGFRIVPLVWLPRVYGLSDRVKDWQAPATGETWPLADVWLDVSAINAKQN